MHSGAKNCIQFTTFCQKVNQAFDFLTHENFCVFCYGSVIDAESLINTSLVIIMLLIQWIFVSIFVPEWKWAQTK